MLSVQHLGTYYLHLTVELISLNIYNSEYDDVSFDGIEQKRVMVNDTEYFYNDIQKYSKTLSVPTHVNLKNEFVYADYNLSVTATRLLYFSMMNFNKDEFYYDQSVIVCGKKFSLVTDDMFKKIFSTRESRTMIIPSSVLIKAISGLDKKSKSSKPLLSAIQSLQESKITTNIKNEANTFNFVNNIAIFDNKYGLGANKSYVLIEFSHAFMPFVVSCAGFNRIEYNIMRTLKTPYAIRYYHWFIHAFTRKENKGRFSIRISALKKRLGIDDNKYKRHFDSRIIEEPMMDIMHNTDLEIYVEELQRQRKNKRKNKLEIASFNISRLPPGIF